MRNILLTISYDGTNFCGWQRQIQKTSTKNPDVIKTIETETARTVQGEIEKVLERLHKVHVTLYGSGRTDSGVHAEGQIANFISPIDSIPIDNYQLAINGMLPKDIRIMNVTEVDKDFHARFSATSRTYRYFIYCGETPNARDINFVWHIHRYPDVQLLNRMASCFQGEIDCTTFSSAQDESLSKKRYLEKAIFWMQGDILVFEITANAFLWRMVRSITGSLLHYEQIGLSANDVKQKLLACNRKEAGPTAPPQGLFLWNVDCSGIRRH